MASNRKSWSPYKDSIIRYVSAHPGCCKWDAAAHCTSNSRRCPSKQYYIVNTAIAAGWIVAERRGNRYALYVPGSTRGGENMTDPYLSTHYRVTLQLVGGGHNKFWVGEVVGRHYFATFGRIGTNGQTQTKKLASSAHAKAMVDKMAEQKRRKGYVHAPHAHPGADPEMLRMVAGELVEEPVIAPGPGRNERILEI